MDETALLADLTEAQRAAATHVDGPLLIIAAAGSGKTRVITRRVAHLVGQGVPPWSILAITFTNKAAGEMKSRVASALGRQIYDFGRLDTRWPTICTFHSLCLRILRHYGPRIGLDGHFSIYDSGDQEKVVKEALKLLELSASNFPPGKMHAAISNAKNKLQTPAMFESAAREFYTKTVAKVYGKYQKLLAERNALDFDDLLMRAVMSFKEHPDVLAELQERFRYLLIDEYQDTNHAQYILAHALAQKHRNICVVGDPDQSIYGWRGADIQNILEFERDYPDAKVVKLEQNYRSTQTILKVADKLIKNNHRRKDKRLFSENDLGEAATVLICPNEHDEAETVARMLMEMKKERGIDWNQMAIFYRINALSRVVEDALRKRNIPYVMARGTEFYNRRVVKDVLGYLRFIANPADEVSLTRIINTPARGISDATVKQMQAAAVGRGIILWEVMKAPASVVGLTERARKAVGAFAGMVEGWRKRTEGSAEFRVQSAELGQEDSKPETRINDETRMTKEEAGISDLRFEISDLKSETPNPIPQTPNPSSTIRDLMEDVVKRSGMESSLKKEESPEGEDPMANVNELISSAAEFEKENPGGTLEDYLSQVALVSDVDRLKDCGGAVTMMTLHAAKGLEFPVVAIVGLEEGLLPHSRARESAAELEEERRLCFVGITRAQKRLILSRAVTRTMRGISERTIASPFLAEMPIEALDVIDRSGWEGSARAGGRGGGADRAGADARVRRQMEREEAREAGSRWRMGQRVRHPMFGVGTIVELSDMGQDTRLVVQFVRVGRKTLVGQYARLEAI